MSALSSLAKVRSPASREALTLGVADICTAKPLSEKASPVAGELLLTLAKMTEERVRIALAAKLAGCAWAPHEVIRFLAFDEIGVARHIITKSPCLTETDLLELIAARGPEHRRAIAERPHIAIPVTDALAAHGEPLTLQALAANPSAAISTMTFDICLKAAAETPALRDLLAKRPDFPASLAEGLCLLVSERLRDELITRFDLDRDTLAEAVAETTTAAGREDEDSLAAKLVTEMGASGALNGAFALRALTQGKDVLFDHAIAALCGVTPGEWRTALALSGVRSAALACRAARIDRGVFPTVHRALARAGRVHPVLEGAAMDAAAQIFQLYSIDKARESLRRIGQSG
ncbi:MAG: DUF2336 domain-containing protein [Maricaulaceae bacterium]|nr:DUF2336 domain-containing protein [Maricaulaceae bacterium]